MQNDNDYTQSRIDEVYELRRLQRENIQLMDENAHLKAFNSQLLDICRGWNDLHETWPELRGAWPGRAMLLLEMTNNAIHRADEEYKR